MPLPTPFLYEALVVMHQALAAYMFSGAIAVVVLFQFALMCGLPWGHLAMGGRYPSRFPPAMRVAAFVQALVLSSFALVALTKAGVIFPQFYDISDTAIWVVAGISVLSLIMNLATPSKWERILWAPVAFVMLASSGWLAMQGNA